MIVANAANDHFDEEACAQLQRDPQARALYRKFLQRLERLCKPGGQLIIVDCSSRNLFADLRMKNPIMTTIDWRIHQPPRVWAELLTEVGFCRPRIDWLPITRQAGLAPLLSRRWAAYLLNSVFRLIMEKPAP